MMDTDGPCIVCGAYDGAHDAGCLLDPSPVAYFTPGELADLRIVRERAAADGNDNAPMMTVAYESRPTHGRAGAAFATRRQVIPWLDALNMEEPD